MVASKVKQHVSFTPVRISAGVCGRQIVLGILCCVIFPACGRAAADQPCLPPVTKSDKVQLENVSVELKRETDPKTARQTVTLSGPGFPSIMYTGQSIPGSSDPKSTVTYRDPIPGMAGGGFGPAFPEITAYVGNSKTPIDLLRGSACVGSHALNGDGWAVAELIFRRILDGNREVTTTWIVKRIAGDPFQYMLIYIHSADQAIRVDNVKLSGYPMSGSSLLFGLSAPLDGGFFCPFQRWIWLAGKDCDLHAGVRHETMSEPGTPPGVFWYNRGANEMGGMMAVFDPAEITSLQSQGGYVVITSLGLKRPLLRLAVRRWYDMQGWEPVRDEFIKNLPEYGKKLRDMSFARPVTDLLDAETRRQIQVLLTSSSADPKQGPDDITRAKGAPEMAAGLRSRLAAALQKYDQLRDRAQTEKTKNDMEIFQREQALLIARTEVDDALGSLRGMLLKH